MAPQNEVGFAMEKFEWWKAGVVYQIYPRSFQDTNGDGIGDLKGIKHRLDYLVELGVQAIWVSPCFPSPMKDFGYDISNYTDIDPVFGTLADFDELIEAAHKRNLKVILDLVPNHTSSLHPWFAEARQSKTNEKRDWYIWKDAKPDGSPPNNWLSNFGGSAWTFDTESNQYYYHAFLPEQPDLNFRNPQVRQAILNVMKFWLSRGVDGFRVDAVAHLVEDDAFRDEPEDVNYEPSQNDYSKLIHVHTVDHAETHKFIREMRKLSDSFPGERVLLTEAYVPLKQLVTYYGEADASEAHLPFNFQLIQSPWKAREIAEFVDAYDAALPAYAWPNWVLGNHDKPRIASRVGHQDARLAALLLLTLRGTPTIYYGDELGMTDVTIPPEKVQDPAEKREPGKGQGRDPERSPMQWDASPFSGFSETEPWLPLADDFKTRNVANQTANAESMLNFYKELLKLRNSTPALAIGDYKTVKISDSFFAYQRKYKNDEMIIALNFSSKEGSDFVLPSGQWTKLFSTDVAQDKSKATYRDSIALSPQQGLLLKKM